MIDSIGQLHNHPNNKQIFKPNQPMGIKEAILTYTEEKGYGERHRKRG